MRNDPFARAFEMRPATAGRVCGASTHPGGHATGAPGYNAANAIAEDIGIAKWWPKFDAAKVLKAVNDQIGL